MTRASHEAGLAAFLLPNHRPRFLASIGDPALRDRLRGQLYHFEPRLDTGAARQLRAGNRNTNVILAELTRLGAPETCHVMSSNDELDDREMVLREAVAATFSSGHGTFISCVPGALAYFENEHGKRYVLSRPARPGP